MSYTPGPWHWTPPEADDEPPYVHAADGTTVAYTFLTRDARLIAAAPELLEVCDRLVHHFNREAVDAAIAVIAKATGGTT